MEILAQIQDFAQKAHGSQQRKFEPQPYIVHLIRVMKICREYTGDRTMLAAALLHDVLEDTPVTKEEITEFLLPLLGPGDTNKTVALVEELTDVYIKNDYPQWNRRRRKQKEAERLGNTSGEAQTIKYADILDNSMTIVDAGNDFAHTFLFEGRSLLQAMKNGDPALRERAINMVDDCIAKLDK